MFLDLDGKKIMSSIFTKIINKEIPAYIVAEDDDFLAFLDINPLVPGHTLVIPKKEIDYLFDIDDNLISSMMIFTKKVAKAIKLTMDCKRVGIGASGFEIPHAHIHVMPIDMTAEMACTNKPVKISPEKMKEIADDIAKTYQQLYHYTVELSTKCEHNWVMDGHNAGDPICSKCYARE